GVARRKSTGSFATSICCANGWTRGGHGARDRRLRELRTDSDAIDQHHRGKPQLLETGSRRAQQQGVIPRSPESSITRVSRGSSGEPLRGDTLMRWILALLATTVVAMAAGIEAPTGFDDQSNGVTDGATHAKNKEAFDEVEKADEGLGPIYNAQSCRECHQHPVSGSSSQVTELRTGRLLRGRFQNPAVPINHGQEVIRGRSLINDRAICPDAQERIPAGNPIRALRISLNLLGDGFVEAIPDATLA